MTTQTSHKILIPATLLILLLNAMVFTACKTTKYETVEFGSPDDKMIRYFLGDRTKAIIHQGDHEYLFESVNMSSSIMTGQLVPMPKIKDNFPLPDTTEGEHPWTRGKKAPWMKAPHLYVRDSVEFPLGAIYFDPKEFRVIRNYNALGKPGPKIHLQLDFTGMVTSIISSSLSSLDNKARNGRSQSPGSGTQQPRGASRPAPPAKVRTFPGKGSR